MPENGFWFWFDENTVKYCRARVLGRSMDGSSQQIADGLESNLGFQPNLIGRMLSCLYLGHIGNYSVGCTVTVTRVILLYKCHIITTCDMISSYSLSTVLGNIICLSVWD